MPNVSTLLSGGVSVGILAGVVSGLFYLVVAGIRWAGTLRAQQRKCEGCGPEQDSSPCPACAQRREVKLQSGEWFYKQVQRRFHPAAIEHSKRDCDDGGGMDPDSIQVREFIERLVESLVSGGLDDVCVKRLHSHPEYKPMPEQESPSSAHLTLKQLIHQIIQEAMTLPTLQELNENSGREKNEDMTSKTYEDILATAILNKVIEQYQENGGINTATLDRNRNLLDDDDSLSSSMEQYPKYITHLEIGVKSLDSLEESLDQSSLSEECSLVADPMSLTIEECIEEVTTISNEEEDESHLDITGDTKLNFYMSGLDFVQHHRVPFPELGMDIVDAPAVDSSDHEDADEEDEDASSSPQPTDLISPVDSWEENWLFQRRRLKSGAVPQSLPVPMLVPNPSEDYRALIGDRDAEEISDLSECSDSVLEDLVLAEEEEENVVENKADETVNKSVQPEQDQCNPETTQSETVDSVVKTEVQCSEPVEEYGSMSEETLDLLEAKNVELYKTSSVDCLSEFGQQDSEYTEDYATVTQRQLDSLSAVSEPEEVNTPASNPSSQDGSLTLNQDEQSEVPKEAESMLAEPPRPGTDDEYCTLPCTGTIAEREHKKWESAPPLPNNPYSPENIGKRNNRRSQYNSRSNSSEASVEFPEFKTEPIIGSIIEQPLQIVCAPGLLDTKRYGRDYYINATPSRSPVPPASTSSLQTSESQESFKPDKEISNISSERISSLQTEEHVEEDMVSHIVESEVARLQKEIDESEQWYKNLLSSKTETKNNISENNKANKNTLSSDLHKFTKVMITEADDGNDFKPLYPDTVDKCQQIPHEDLKHETIYGKTSFKQIKFPTYQEHQNNPDIHITTRNGDMKNNAKRLPFEESYVESCFNGSGRSDSPSEGSAISSDSDFNNLPSVKELTKRFASLADSDSSASIPKCPSPAPRWKVLGQQPEAAERTIVITGRASNQNPTRAVREVHSLTARSISREFREGLRQNQPLQLDRNLYNQSGSCTSLTASSTEETPSSMSDDRDTPSPGPLGVTPQSMRSNIAFWEQMQHDKT